MAQSLNLIFCGTPQFAVPILDKLSADGFHIQLVVTQPDRPKGRGLEIVSSPVKQRALQLGSPVTQPERIKHNEEFRDQLTRLKPDAIVVVGYGRIIPQWMLDLPRFGNINLHASLLPKYRGAAPIQWAIALGETVTGVTTMKIDAGLDTGDVLMQQEVSIAADETAEALAPRLATVGADLTVETLSRLQAGAIQPRPQDNSRATLAPILKKADGLVDFTLPAPEILNRLRGFQPWPGAYTRFHGKNFQIWKAAKVDRLLAPAEMLVDDDRLFVGCGEDTAIEMLEVQLEGKKRTSAAEFVRGYHPRGGEKLGS